MLPMRVLLAVLASCFALPAAAQSRFRAASADAMEIPGELGTFGGALFESCETGGAACRRTRRADQRLLRRRSWLMSVPALGHVELGPYESVREGFLVRVPSFQVALDGGVAASHRSTGGRTPREVLGEQFVPVPPEHAERWLARNAQSRMRLRLVVRFGATWQDGERAGVDLQIRGIQVYNESTGDVLLDSLDASEASMPGPPDLDERALLWDRHTTREARWRNAEGIPLLFSVRVEAGHGDAQRPVLLFRSAIADVPIATYPAPCCTASLALSPRGPGEILVIFTERRPEPNAPGRGRVELWRWTGTAFVQRARWEGANDDTPPAWVRDPTVAPP